MNWTVLAVSVLALAAIAWGVALYDWRAAPLVVGIIVYVDLFMAGRRADK